LVLRFNLPMDSPSQNSPASSNYRWVICGLLFFATTNLAVWYVWYPHTLAGATRCYASALPFLGYSLTGDLLSAGALFAVYALAMQSASAPKSAVVRAKPGKQTTGNPGAVRPPYSRA